MIVYYIKNTIVSWCKYIQSQSIKTIKTKQIIKIHICSHIQLIVHIYSLMYKIDQLRSIGFLDHEVIIITGYNWSSVGAIITCKWNNPVRTHVKTILWRRWCFWINWKKMMTSTFMKQSVKCLYLIVKLIFCIF